MDAISLRRPALWMACALPIFFLLTLQSPLALAAPRCMGSFRTMGDVGISAITVSQSVDGLINLMDRRDLQNSKIKMKDGTFAHAVEYTIRRNTWRPIATLTNTWCSAGGYLPDSTILNTAGNDAGLNAVRMLRPCSKKARGYANGGGPTACNEWWEDGRKIALASKRWYPTMCTLPNGKFILVGGSTGGTSVNQIVPSYEFVDPINSGKGRNFDLPFLRRSLPNYLYPFVHLLPSDTLFIFANVDGIIFDYKRNRVIKNVPKIPDGISRSYPSTAASLLLPLDYKNGFMTSEVLICGGNAVNAGPATPATASCWIAAVGGNPGWRGPFRMARGRCMPDMLYLMDGSILVINGVENGVAGFYTAKNANYWPEVLKYVNGRINVNSNYCPSPIKRGYHSEALLIPDGRVFVSGSNPNPRYVTNPRNEFNTEYRVEMWTPPYLTTRIPRLNIKGWPKFQAYGRQFNVPFTFPFKPDQAPSYANIRVTLISNSFTTHSMSMSLRYINLNFRLTGNWPMWQLAVTAPPNAVIAPQGPYMLAITYRDIPAWAPWVIIG